MAKVMVSLPEDLLSEVDAEARRAGTTRSAVMREFADRALRRRREGRVGNAIAPRGDGTPRRTQRGPGQVHPAGPVTTLLLDASVVLAAFDPDDKHHESAQALLEDDETALATIDLARYEVANVVLASTGTLLTRAAEIAETHTISVYDAAYVAAATDNGLRLISCDERDLVSKDLAVPPASARE